MIRQENHEKNQLFRHGPWHPRWVTVPWMLRYRAVKDGTIELDDDRPSKASKVGLMVGGGWRSW